MAVQASERKTFIFTRRASLGLCSTIPDYPGYIVTSKGRVFNVQTREEVNIHKTAKGYRGVWLKDEEGKGKQFYVHRLVAMAFIRNNDSKRIYVDHIDGVKTNNVRTNLRWATHSENGRNSKIQCNSTSGFKGVSFDKRRNKWMARIWVNSKCKFLGRYDTREEAVAARRAAATLLHGEFARLE